MNILSYDHKLQHHNYNSPLAIKLFLAKLCRYNARDTVAIEWETPLSMASACRKDPIELRKQCGEAARTVRKDCRKTAETVWGLSCKAVTQRRCCGNSAERLRKDCRNIADTMRNKGGPTADATSECTPGPP